MTTAARRLGFSPMIPAPKKAKAGRQPRRQCIIDDIPFASETEGAFYRVLKLLRSAGRIAGIEPHPAFPFQAKFTNARGIKRRARRYTADFRVTLADGSTRVYEVKGAKKKDRVVVGPYIVNETEFKMRRDAVELQYGIAIWTVYPDGGQWIDADTKLPVVWP